MVKYKCFKCGKEMESSELKKRFLCSVCGSKIFFKPRTKLKKVKSN